MNTSRKISRRQLLRLSATVGIGSLVSACAPPNTTQPFAGSTAEQQGVGAVTEQPTVTPIPTPPGFSTTGSKGSIRVVYWADRNNSFRTVVERFTEETEIGVDYEVAPGDYLTWQQMMTTRFAAGDTTVDSFHCDDFQAAIYGSAGWLEELDPIIKANNIDLSDWPQTLIKDVSSWGGKLYRLPWGNDTEIFFYRTDFFAEAGVEPPKTWDELLRVGKALTRDGRYGILLCGKNNNILGNDIQHWTNQAGGAINDLDNDGAKQALQFYKDMFAVHKIAPPSTPQEDYSSGYQGWLSNKYAMWWCWDGFLGAMRNNKEFWKGQVSAFLPPMGPKNAQTTTGCWGWSISAFSTKKDLAEKWIEFTARPEIMKLQILRGRAPARISLWSDKEVQDKAPSTPYLVELYKAGPDLLKARPVTPSIQEIWDIAEQNVHAFLTDQVDLDTAVRNAMARIRPILERDLRKR